MDLRSVELEALEISRLIRIDDLGRLLNLFQKVLDLKFIELHVTLHLCLRVSYGYNLMPDMLNGVINAFNAAELPAVLTEQGEVLFVLLTGQAGEQLLLEETGDACEIVLGHTENEPKIIFAMVSVVAVACGGLIDDCGLRGNGKREVPQLAAIRGSEFLLLRFWVLGRLLCLCLRLHLLLLFRF